MDKIIKRDRSIVPACDVPLEVFKDIAMVTEWQHQFGALKIGPALTGRPGYDKVIAVAKKYTQKPLVVDPQKWGTDIPDTAEKILAPVKESGIDAIILFPQSGPATEYAWINAAQNLELKVIVGGEMTHPRYLSNDVGGIGERGDYINKFGLLGIDVLTPGFIREDAPLDMYKIAAKMGVTNFVLPGNKPDKITQYKHFLIGAGVKDPITWSPGLISQGGDLSEGAKAAGDNFHAIIGRGIYWNKEEKRYKTRQEMEQAAQTLSRKI